MYLYIAYLLLFLEMIYLFKILNFSVLKCNLPQYHSEKMEYTLDYKTEKVIFVDKPHQL